jgi:hypothetical protein
LEISISDKEEILVFYMFPSSFYNSCSVVKVNTYKSLLIRTKQITSKPLSQVLDKYQDDRCVDFRSIDEEVWDRQVLNSDNQNKYSPKIILINFFSQFKDDINETEIGIYLMGKEYFLLCNSLTNN